jgi:peptidoglycan/xylan/chitin deacetylase (PgdA/CDA1 family)
MTAPVVLNFDNLGEASELEHGRWPAERPLGAHPSVTDALPRLLELLDELDLHATFFVEAINTQAYPDAIDAIAARGHEIGFHGWRHERWADLEPDREVELVARSFAAYADRGIIVRAFRPPGGGLTAQTLELLAAQGATWCSPEGTRAGRLEPTGLIALPFRWPLVDATYLHEPFDALRDRLGLPPAGLSADATQAALTRELADEPDPLARTLTLHAFLMADPVSGALHERLLRGLAEGPDRVIPGGVRADELRADASTPVAVLA